MTTLRCTHKLLARLGLPASLKSPHPPTNALGNWYMNLLRIGRHQLVIATSERSLFTVLLPARDLSDSLSENLLLAVEYQLVAIGISPERASQETSAMFPITWGNTANRSVLGSMTDMAMRLPLLLAGGRTIYDAMRDLNNTPMSGIATAEERMPYPVDVALVLLAKPQLV